MKFTLLLAFIATLAVLFACLLPVLIKHGFKKSDIRTTRARRYKVRFQKLNLMERLFAPFVRAMEALQLRTQRWFGSSRLVAANIAEGQHEGHITKLTDATIATRFLMVKKGTNTAHIAVCSAITDRPMGVCQDEATAAEENVNVALLGARKDTLIGVASGAIASGSRLATTATGKLQVAVTTQFVIGIAITDSAVDGDLIEFDPINPMAAI